MLVVGVLVGRFLGEGHETVQVGHEPRPVLVSYLRVVIAVCADREVGFSDTKSCHYDFRSL